MLKYLIAAGVLLGASAPALAEEYYVVRDSTTKKCTVVSQKPTTTTTTVVGDDGVTFKTESEAEAGMKKIKVCSSSD
jgi:hypothetical protein